MKPMPPERPVLHPNEIDAMYKQMQQAGWKYVGMLGPPLDEWKAQEMQRWRIAEAALKSQQ